MPSSSAPFSSAHERIAALAANLSALRRLGALIEQIEQGAADALGIARSDLRCLELLIQNGPQTAGELAEAIGLSPNAFSTALRRLEAKAYIRRTHPAANRRQVVVTITEEARAVVSPVSGRLIRLASQLFRHYELADIERVTSFLKNLGDTLRPLAED